MDEGMTRRTRQCRDVELCAALSAVRRRHADVCGTDGPTRYGPRTCTCGAAVIFHAWRRPIKIMNALISPVGNVLKIMRTGSANESASSVAMPTTATVGSMRLDDGSALGETDACVEPVTCVCCVARFLF